MICIFLLFVVCDVMRDDNKHVNIFNTKSLMFVKYLSSILQKIIQYTLKLQGKCSLNWNGPHTLLIVGSITKRIYKRRCFVKKTSLSSLALAIIFTPLWGWLWQDMACKIRIEVILNRFKQFCRHESLPQRYDQRLQYSRVKKY